ncbi:hypothetical protein IAR55_000640 [Kwoniella newhampshirensis]|uniref:CST complex subunit Stn1 N-terminal domain-containing protein n=1 Tax=Kwoniella newhampshirensis TaxID=1651941 RepID=A0AAW0Z799_9TREE
MVEIVGWVAGVDHKETTMTVTLDDGDGEHVLPVLIRLSLVKLSTRNPVEAKPTDRVPSAAFASAATRNAAKRKAIDECDSNGYPVPVKRAPLKVYDRKDVRVGDTVRIVGKIDEWQRRKASGEVEWVRQVVVEEGAGGSIFAVDPDAQHIHAAEVCRLHEVLYARPFVISDIQAGKTSQPPTPIKSLPRFSDSIEPTSETPSDLTIMDAEPELRDPARLRSSQLTDRTFRQYMLDHMTQETIKALRTIADEGPGRSRAALEATFPEYRPPSCRAKKGKDVIRSDTNVGLFTPSTRHNSMMEDHSSTPTPRSSRLRKVVSQQSPLSPLKPFTISSVLSDERLNTLARLVVDNEVRKEERRRKRRIRDGLATKKDLTVEAERKALGWNKIKEYCLPVEERKYKMEKLVGWVIRNVAEEGSLVQVRLSKHQTGGNGEQWGYLPLPPQLLLPLLVLHLEAERNLRKSTFRRKGDPRNGNGMTVDELVIKMRRWGEEGRWERVGDWKIEEAVEWGEEQGWLRREGRGWWVIDGGMGQ